MSKIKAILELIRPYQWAKNVFVIAPLFFTPHLMTWDLALFVFDGFICFSLLSSAVYILNDYKDYESDKLHPVKQHRPIAAGKISKPEAFFLFGIFLVTGFIGALSLSLPFALVGLLYVIQNIAYCYYLKHKPIIDILTISLGFVLRIVAGAMLVNVTPSVWILVCSGLLAFFLAIAKRRDDIVSELDGTHRKSLQGYSLHFIDTCMMIALSALFVSYTIYTTDHSVMEQLHSKHLYYTVPFVFAGILRYLQITLVEHRSGSPTRILYSDSFLLITILGWIMTYIFIIYLSVL